MQSFLLLYFTSTNYGIRASDWNTWKADSGGFPPNQQSGTVKTVANGSEVSFKNWYFKFLKSEPFNWRLQEENQMNWNSSAPFLHLSILVQSRMFLLMTKHNPIFTYQYSKLGELLGWLYWMGTDFQPWITISCWTPLIQNWLFWAPCSYILHVVWSQYHFHWIAFHSFIICHTCTVSLSSKL